MFDPPSISALTARLSGLLFPDRCFCCGTVGETPWCVDCRRRMRPMVEPICARCGAMSAENCCKSCSLSPPPFTCARSAAHYEEPVRTLILWFKYYGYLTIAPLLVQLLVQLVESDAAYRTNDIDAVVPVPTRAIKRWLRGFNPAQILADGLAVNLGKPCLAKALTRLHRGPDQVRLRGADRVQNLIGAMRVCDGTLVEGKRLLLVDDVFTTGATCAEASRALRAGGALEIRAVTVARG